MKATCTRWMGRFQAKTREVPRKTMKTSALLSPAVIWCIASMMIMASSKAGAESPASESSSRDGQLQIPGFWLPYSEYASEEAEVAFVEIVRRPPDPPMADIAAKRAQADEGNRKWLAKARARYPVEITRQIIEGVPVDVVVPANGVKASNSSRVLINMHGGAFMWGAGAGGQLEAVPLASVLGIKVVTIDYRMGPEFKFPAASEDVAAVYKALLKTYRPENIGIYGCSAGGLLTAQSLAWFQKERLPRPGAAGVFCAGGGDLGGDSLYWGGPLNGEPPVPQGGRGLRAVQLPYLSEALADDPLAFPMASGSVMAAFPPTLVITGTRDFMMSSAINQHRLLINAGVEADLHVWDGMWHAFFMDADVPESREAYVVMAKFFDRHLGTSKGKRSGRSSR